MAHLINNEVVRYACTCGQLKPLSLLYFCRHCLKSRCEYCVCHGVDIHYCSHCMEINPASEAKLKKNRCAACFDCPFCMATLTLRSTTVVCRDPASQAVISSKKMFYHSCHFCRWTTRDSGLPDQTVQSVASSGWLQRDGRNEQRLTALLEHARMLVCLERHEREPRGDKLSSRTRRSYPLSGLTSAQVRKRAGLPPEIPSASTIKESIAQFKPSTAVEEVEELPEDLLTKKLDLNEVTTLKQRLTHPEYQPAFVADLVPAHKNFVVKCSQRCRECEHNISKPELTPVSIKFKIRQVGYNHVPEVRIIKLESLKAGLESELTIIVSNPSQHQTTLNFLTLEQALILEDAQKSSEEMPPEIPQNVVPPQEGPPSLLGTLKSLSKGEEPRPVKINLTGDINLPSPDVKIILPPKDDTSEYDDASDTQQFEDDPKFVTHRIGNKASIRLAVTPHADSTGEDCLVAFALQYTYMNKISSPTSAPPEQKEPQQVQLCVKLYINCGMVSE